ncbi:uncharacterized protein LOC144139703 [Haemaphysalis longicornis]
MGHFSLSAIKIFRLVELSHDFTFQNPQLYHRHVRLLFYILAVYHRCIVRVDLTNALYEGGTLDEILRLAVKPLLENSSLRILNVISLPDRSTTLAALLATIATMIRLQGLRFNSFPVALLLVHPFQTLIFNTHRGDREWKRLLAAVMVNCTVTTLSVNTNIMLPRSSSDVAYFLHYLKTATWLASLTSHRIFGGRVV